MDHNWKMILKTGEYYKNYNIGGHKVKFDQSFTFWIFYFMASRMFSVLSAFTNTYKYKESYIENILLIKNIHIMHIIPPVAFRC